MEEDVHMRHLKRGKPGCNRHQTTGGTRGRHELFDQNSVRSKMSNFHADLASIEVSRCTTWTS